MGIEMIKPGLLTTVQDFGRTGYQKLGISPSGALDRKAMILANLLVANSAGEAVLEITMMGPELRFTADNFVAVTGGDLSPVLNGAPMPRYAAIPVKDGDVLSFGPAKSGCRAYLAFAGGLKLPVVMGSKSTNLKCGFGGYGGRKLQAGDAIAFSSPKKELPFFPLRTLEAPSFGGETILRVILGPQEDAFTEEGVRTFFEETYQVTPRFDRMGCALDGPVVECRDKADIISDGIPAGAVQIPSSGKPIIMLADRQTTGGYTKIGTVASVDLSLLAQCRPGDSVRFQRISVGEAQKLLRKETKKLSKLNRYLNE
ncbi:KipI antagonist [Caprobacter fermentans]|uniref:Biotin-dependent carboxyltransferase family protein n=1 Tax=Caproicibacter fermentans TaxID=2576756 RepID=A0A6N8I0J6_9FIRM|nr:biotin-dependent carboxyltransferase family protein [Caproicibacter fermentans]MVB11247.1 KipI antagonist [Caproicibacter fermentans]OCN00108.1 KipI antagonist [Clostridium sp. W14A]QNK41943.1 biotin-dependent carboxyltransferase family protein [Caproicibacter fermentans]